MADFAATAGKTDDMTHANAKIVPPARHENRMAARAYALVMRWLVRLAALITVAILVFLIGYILVNGIPNLKPSLFEWTYNSDNVSLMPALINTILMTAFSLAIATPLGIFAAVWLVEYAKRGSKLVKVVRITTETLQGIPSIVYGLFGMLFFVMQLKWGYSLIAGAFTLAIICIALGVAVPNLFFRRFIEDTRKRKLLAMLVERKKRNGEFVTPHAVGVRQGAHRRTRKEKNHARDTHE